MKPGRKNLLLMLVALAWLASCNLPSRQGASGIGSGSTLSELPIAQPLPAMNMTIINFQVEVPGDTPDEQVFLSVLDEVTGLGLNPSHFEMKGIPAPAPGAKRLYVTSLPVTIGSIITYHYERQTLSSRVSEHIQDGSQVRYRIFVVQGPGTVKDIISRWTDTDFQGRSGRITGIVTDTATGEPLADILVTAGGAQTLTSVDGSFRIDGLPEGVHNLAAISLDGSYRPFQQGALVASDSSTDASIHMDVNPVVRAIFVTRVPDGTPPVIPIRMAGNLYQLGNSFGTLTGGMSTQATAMPALAQLPDGRYMLTLTLPVGADLRYKYTLGDGFWNAEHNRDGSFKLRQLIVPDRDFLIEESVETWYAGSANTLTFDVSVPAGTPAEDFISIQFNPLFGWTEPIPMWHLGEDRWGYVLYSPLNLPGNLSYRFCRNSQCGAADDILTPGKYGQGRPVQFSDQPQTLSLQVTEWLNLPWESNPIPIREVNAAPQSVDFITGIELDALYHPSFRTLLPNALDEIQAAHANQVILTPTWTFNANSNTSPYPLISPIPAQDMVHADLVEAIAQVRQRSMQAVLFPTPRFPVPPSEWWQAAGRDEVWWNIWFEEYRAFLINHAVIANQNGVTGLILGGDWLRPALPGGVILEGSPSNVPVDAETRWRNIISDLRSNFQGQIYWALPQQDASRPPAFLDTVDGVYLLWTLSPEINAAASQGVDLVSEFGQTLDNTILTLQVLAQKPIVLALSSPADPDPQAQFNAYQAMLLAASQRNVINGFVGRGFYPAAALNDPSGSVHGKPVLELLKYWFGSWRSIPVP